MAIDPRIDFVAEIILGLLEAADRGARAAARAGRRLVAHRRRGRTLVPGPGTPLWNVLVQHVKHHLHRRGSKARLARLLGLPRQRLNDCLVAGKSCLDAERTLMLVCWLAGQYQGKDFNVPGAPP